MTLEEKADRYNKLAHAMQSGVAAEIAAKGEPDAAASPKHLRVGVNAAMADHGALVALLISKGIFTEDEYYNSLIEFMEREAQRYQDLLSAHYGKPVTLV